MPIEDDDVPPCGANGLMSFFGMRALWGARASQNRTSCSQHISSGKHMERCQLLHSVGMRNIWSGEFLHLLPRERVLSEFTFELMSTSVVLEVWFTHICCGGLTSFLFYLCFHVSVPVAREFQFHFLVMIGEINHVLFISPGRKTRSCELNFQLNCKFCL